nr:hypothetical protein BaRGS_031031 [Batillaria attramentaria]
MKARDVARIIRSEHALLDLLVEEKKGAEKNKRFKQDFKTLADVLIQQMVSHDLVQQFPEMKGSVYGEESNQFTNTLGETKTICLCATTDLTRQLLMDILDDNEEAATLLSEVVHRKAAAIPPVDKLGQVKTEIDSSDVGIWIDPIDLKAFEVGYQLSSSQSGASGKSINGIIAYSCPEVLESIVQSLV